MKTTPSARPASSRLLGALAAALTSLLLSSVPVAAQGGTIIPGGFVGGTTWTAAGSPYSIQGDIQVSLLTIDAGVEVQLAGPYKIEVLSTMTCAGTEQAPILFHTLSPAARWKGFKFVSTPPGTSFAHTIIEGANESAFTLSNCAAPFFDRCTIRGCSSTGHGGAINASGVQTDLRLLGCVFSNNTSAVHGGAMRVAMSAPANLIVDRCSFVNNIANPNVADGEYEGGALYLEAGDSTITRCLFRANQCIAACTSTFDCYVTARGGAVYIGSGGQTTIQTTAFMENVANAVNRGRCFFGGRAFGYGAGVFSAAGTVNMSNCVFARNVSTGSGCGPSFAGGGVFVNAGTFTLTNSTIARNPNGNGVHVAGGTATIANSIIFFNNNSGQQIGGSPTVTYSDVEGGYPGAGNISYSPVFGSLDCEIIRHGSPCVDAGDPAPSANDACITSANRPFGPALGTARNDMGAHGGPLACDWVELNPQLVLSATPNPIVAPADLTFVAAGGDPRAPVAVALTGVNGVPVTPALVLWDVFCADRQHKWIVPVPPLTPLPVTVTFRAYAADWLVNVFSSAELTVTIR